MAHKITLLNPINLTQIQDIKPILQDIHDGRYAIFTDSQKAKIYMVKWHKKFPNLHLSQHDGESFPFFLQFILFNEPDKIQVFNVFISKVKEHGFFNKWVHDVVKFNPIKHGANKDLVSFSPLRFYNFRGIIRFICVIGCTSIFATFIIEKLIFSLNRNKVNHENKIIKT